MESRLANVGSARFESWGSAVLIILYAFLWIVYASELRFFASLPFVALFVVIPGACVLAYRHSRQKQDALFFLALACSTLPFFSYHVLEISLLSFLSCSALLRAFYRQDKTACVQPQLPLPLLLFLLSLLSAAFMALRAQSDLWNLNSIVTQGGFSGLFSYLWTDPRSWNATALIFSGEIIAILLFRELIRQRASTEAQLSFIRGLAVGGLLAVLILFLQFVGPEVFSFNRGAFWHISGRYPATFSDPNAAGVFAVLALPLLYLLRGNSKARVLSLAAYLLIAAFSGSRTFLLGLGFYFLFTLSRKKSFAKILLSLLIGILVLAYPPINKSLAAFSQSLFHLPTLDRILQTLNWEQAWSMLSNRFLYAKLAFRVWQESPLFGVGLGGFYALQDAAAKSSGLDLGGWKDNANNYYLQILAERGLSGLLLVIFAWGIFLRALFISRLNSDFTRALCLLLPVFLLISLSGPHLNFSEVRAVLFSLLALSNAPLPRSRAGVYSGLALGALLLSSSLFYSPKFTSRGLYGAEQSERGVSYWSSQRARFLVCSNSAEDLVLLLRSLNPSTAAQALKVELRVEDKLGHIFSRVYELKDANWLRLDISKEAPLGPHPLVSFEVERTWIPGSDKRSLGVQLELANGKRLDSECKLEDFYVD